MVLLAVCLPPAGLTTLYVVVTHDDPPPDDSDLRVERVDVPDEENGYVDLCAAGDALWQPEGSPERADDDTPWEELDERQRYWRITNGEDWDQDLAAKVLARNRETLGLVATALAKPHFQLPTTPDNYVKPNVLHMLAISQLLELRVRAAAHAGTCDEAFEAAWQLTRLGRRVQQGKGDLIDWFLGTTIVMLGADQTREMLPGTELPVNELKAYVARLAPTSGTDEGLADAFRSEYAFAVRQFSALKNRETTVGGMGGNGQAGPDTWTLVKEWPAIEFTFKLNRTKRRAAGVYRALVACTTVPYADMKRPELASLAELRQRDFLNRTGNIVCSMFARTAVRHPFTHKCEIKIRVHVICVLLAMRVFEMEKGRLPETLEELVPEYLDAVPADDFDGEPLRYDPEKRIIYSVGENLLDDGGFTPDEAREWWQGEHPEEAEERPQPPAQRLPDPSWPIEF